MEKIQELKLENTKGDTTGFKLKNLMHAFENTDKEILKQHFPYIFYTLLDLKNGIENGTVMETDSLKSNESKSVNFIFDTGDNTNDESVLCIGSMTTYKQPKLLETIPLDPLISNEELNGLIDRIQQRLSNGLRTQINNELLTILGGIDYDKDSTR